MSDQAKTLLAILTMVKEIRRDMHALKGVGDVAEPEKIVSWAMLPERLLLENAAPYASMQAATLRKHVAKSRGRLGVKVRGKWVVFRDPFFAFLSEQGRVPKRIR